MHACIAIDGSSQKYYSAGKSSRKNYKNFLRQYYWVIQPMIGGAINVSTTKFGNIKSIEGISKPDLADIIYHIFRCTHLHGNSVSTDFEFTYPKDGAVSWKFADGKLNIPIKILWALLAVIVFSAVNKDVKSKGDYFLSLGKDKFIIREWWGREKDFEPIAKKNEYQTYTITGLGEN